MDIVGALRELGHLITEARRGGFNRTHLRRIRRAAWYAASSHQIFLLIFLFVIASFFLVSMHWAPPAVAFGVVGVPFLLVTLALLCDTVLASWEKQIGRALWCLIMVLLFGAVLRSIVLAIIMAPTPVPSNPALQPLVAKPAAAER